MPGTCSGVDLAIWRSATGKIAAWKDRCPHRGMRLSHGFVRGETLSCIYHGWVYGSDGGCQRIPAHPAMQPPASIRTESFACREQDGVIWVNAAPATARDAPPALPGLQPLRSLTFLLDPAGLAQAVPELAADHSTLRGGIRIGANRAEICLVMQQKSPGQTVVHALCGLGDDRVAVSRWLESLRRRAEMERAA